MRKKNMKGKNGGVRIPSKQVGNVPKHHLPTPSPSPEDRKFPRPGGMIGEYVEVWDYMCGVRFRGFVAEKNNGRSFFIFFDQEVIGQDLKPALMALLELASCEGFDCSQIIICVDRQADHEDVEDVTKGLNWAGFELMMLDNWAGAEDCISERWLFLGMEV